MITPPTAPSSPEYVINQAWYMSSSFHGKMRMPIAAAIRPPSLKLTRRGARFAKPFAGATMLAAMLVVSVATRIATIATIPSNGLRDSAVSRANRSTGFQIARPYSITVALVTATPMNANSGIVGSRPSAWPPPNTPPPPPQPPPGRPEDSEQRIDRHPADPGLDAEPSARDHRPQERRDVRAARAECRAGEHGERNPVARPRVGADHERNEHDHVAQQDRDETLPPVHPCGDHARGEHVCWNAYTHLDPERRDVPHVPGALADPRGRQVGVDEWPRGQGGGELDHRAILSHRESRVKPRARTR